MSPKKAKRANELPYIPLRTISVKVLESITE